jgi:hypothetical protein
MIGPAGTLLFVCISALGVAASLDAWRTRTQYGLYRFLGFESVALLVAWNAHRWFTDPLEIHQLASWTIFVASVALAVHGFRRLRSVGNARRRLMEDTQSVVVVGAYRTGLDQCGAGGAGNGVLVCDRTVGGTVQYRPVR